MGALKLNHDDEPDLRDRLEQVVREALKPHLTVGRKTSTEMLESATEVVVDALRRRFAIGARRPRPRRETPRALAARLPDAGVVITTHRKGHDYTVRVVGEHAVELECDGRVEGYESLRAVATAIMGYAPSVGGWQFFFGTMTRAEVSARYGRQSP